MYLSQGPHSHILMMGVSEWLFGAWNFGQKRFFGSMKDARIFFGCEKNQKNFWGYEKRTKLKKTSEFFG